MFDRGSGPLQVIRRNRRAELEKLGRCLVTVRPDPEQRQTRLQSRSAKLDNALIDGDIARQNQTGERDFADGRQCCRDNDVIPVGGC